VGHKWNKGSLGEQEDKDDLKLAYMVVLRGTGSEPGVMFPRGPARVAMNSNLCKKPGKGRRAEPLAPPQMRRVPWGKPSGVYHHITVDRGQDVSLKLLGGDHCRIRLNELTATLKAPISIGGCFDERPCRAHFFTGQNQIGHTQENARGKKTHSQRAAMAHRSWVDLAALQNGVERQKFELKSAQRPGPVLGEMEVSDNSDQACVDLINTKQWEQAVKRRTTHLSNDSSDLKQQIQDMTQAMAIRSSEERRQEWQQEYHDGRRVHYRRAKDGNLRADNAIRKTVIAPRQPTNSEIAGAPAPVRTPGGSQTARPMLRVGTPVWLNEGQEWQPNTHVPPLRTLSARRRSIDHSIGEHEQAEKIRTVFLRFSPDGANIPGQELLPALRSFGFPASIRELDKLREAGSENGPKVMHKVGPDDCNLAEFQDLIKRWKQSGRNGARDIASAAPNGIADTCVPAKKRRSSSKGGGRKAGQSSQMETLTGMQSYGVPPLDTSRTL